MRVIVRKERPHPGVQLRITDHKGMRITAFATNAPRGQLPVLELFDRWGWSWFYWCWIEGFADTEAAARLRRPRPVAIAGEDAQWGTGPDGWQATWYGSGGDVPSIFWIPEELDVELLVDDHPADLARDGAVVRIGPVEGEHLLRVV